MGGAGHEVGNAHGTGVNTCSHQAGIVRHIHKQISTHTVGDGTESFPVYHQCISRSARHDHLGLVFVGQLLHGVVVNLFFGIEAVANRVIQLAADIDRCAMGEVATVGQRHTEYGVARFKHRHIHRLIGLRTGVRLHVGVFRTKQRFQAVYRQLFSLIHILATAVVTFAGVTFRIFISQLAALRFHYRRAGVVLGGDQLDVIFLATVFILNHGPQIGISLSDGIFT